MERKTKINAEDGKQELVITREFDLPLELLFKAHVEPDIIEQWMSNEYATTKVLKLERKNHGSWQLETTDEVSESGSLILAGNADVSSVLSAKREMIQPY